MKLRKTRLKKTLPEALQAVRDAHPDVPVEPWTMDEHRIGRKPIIRRVWRRKGRRPIVTVQHRDKWMYLYGFVCPISGQTFWLVLPTVSVQAYNVRAGVEGTLSQGIRAFELRQSRYRGLARTHLHHILTAAAMNSARFDAWVTGRPRAKTRISHFEALRPRLAAAA